ncbi:hypothetical protein AHY30_005031, partial [Salmonella enterica subsp. enterica serovar Lexington]|nr:hypothetical protein [Salmonella enterica subsp. enterica serovar Lexington]
RVPSSTAGRNEGRTQERQGRKPRPAGRAAGAGAGRAEKREGDQMTPEIRRRIYAFRNALVLAADTRSNECFRMGHWKELNEFLHDQASNS